MDTQNVRLSTTGGATESEKVQFKIILTKEEYDELERRKRQYYNLQ